MSRLFRCIEGYNEGYIIAEYGGPSTRYMDRSGKWHPTSAKGIEPFRTRFVAEMALGEIRKRELNGAGTDV